MGISKLYHNIHDPEVWVETTRDWQEGLDKAAKYCPIFPGLAQSLVGLTQIIAGIAIRSLQMDYRGRESMPLDHEQVFCAHLVQEGKLNFLDGLCEIIWLTDCINDRFAIA